MPYTYTPVKRVFRTTEEVEQLINGRQVVEPTSYAKRTTASRLVVTDSGPIPLLWLMAEKKFGPFDPKTNMVYWVDRDCQNESLDNVGIIPLSSNPEPRKSKYGIPAGTAEYYKRYRKANPQKRKEYQRSRYQRMRDAEKQARLERDLRAGVPPVQEAVLADKLFSIIGAPEDVTEGYPAAGNADHQDAEPVNEVKKSILEQAAALVDIPKDT